MVKFFKYILFVFLCLLGTISIFLSACYIMGPPPIDMEVTTIFYDQSDEALEPMTDQQTLSLDEVPTTILTATVITEDRNFYSHYGFDFKGIIRAIWKNIKTQSLKEGASTITQQYARNLYLTHEKTWLRKVKEAFYTIRLEMFYTKEEILTGYLHAIYYGHGAYGIEEASQVYFDKHASELTLAESAMLAGIPKGPTYYSPFNDEEKAINRQKGILKQMLQADLITQADYYEAIEETLEFDEPHVQEESFANFFTDTVLKEASTLLHGDEQVVLSGNYHIYTTLDKDYQQQLEKLVMEDVAEKSELEIGVLSIDSKSGAIIGLMGGTSYKDSSFNRVIEAKRMVGSTFKPFVYYTALEQGFTPSTMLLSEPTTFELEENQTYEPKNYNGYYAYAPISLAQALALSDNIYAVKTNLFLGSDSVIKTANKLGITSELPNVPSLALGSASVSLLEMVRAYGIFANEGKEVDIHTIRKIENDDGEIIYERKDSEPKQILDNQKAFVLNHLMMGMFDNRLNGYMNVTGSSIIDQLSRTYAGKSGTTNADNWMIGYSPKITTGVWTGFDDNQPIKKAADKTIAKQVWAQAIEMGHEEGDEALFEVPDGVEKAIVDPETGMLATSDCNIRRAAYFESGTAPKEYCTRHLPKDKPKTEEEDVPLFKRLLKFFH